jgi:hypothetical protein
MTSRTDETSRTISYSLKQVHIIDTSVSKLSTAEGLILLHLLNGVDGNVITVCSLRNVIV